MQPPPDSIIVRVVQEPVRSTTIVDVLLGSLGLVGALLFAALVLGVILGGGMIALKLLAGTLQPRTDTRFRVLARYAALAVGPPALLLTRRDRRPRLQRFLILQDGIEQRFCDLLAIG